MKANFKSKIPQRNTKAVRLATAMKKSPTGKKATQDRTIMTRNTKPTTFKEPEIIEEESHDSEMEEDEMAVEATEALQLSEENDDSDGSVEENDDSDDESVEENDDSDDESVEENDDSDDESVEENDDSDDESVEEGSGVECEQHKSEEVAENKVEANEDKVADESEEDTSDAEEKDVEDTEQKTNDDKVKPTTEETILAIKAKELIDILEKDGSKQQQIELASAIYNLVRVSQIKHSGRIESNNRPLSNEQLIRSIRIKVTPLSRQYWIILNAENEAGLAALADEIYSQIKGHVNEFASNTRDSRIIKTLLMSTNEDIKSKLFHELKEASSEFMSNYCFRCVLNVIMRSGNDEQKNVIKSLFAKNLMNKAKNIQYDQKNTNKPTSNASVIDQHGKQDLTNRKNQFVGGNDEQLDGMINQYLDLLRRFNLKDANRIAYDIYDKIQGRVIEMLRWPYRSVITRMFQLGTENIKNKIYSELEDKIQDLKDTQKCVLLTVVKYGSDDQRTKVVNSLPEDYISPWFWDKFRKVQEKRKEKMMRSKKESFRCYGSEK